MEISDESETWPNRIIFLWITAPWLLKKAYIWLYQNNSFSFYRIILKLAEKVDMGEVFDKFEKVWKLIQSDR